MNYIKQTYDFLEQLSQNNNREWFKAHKEEYDSLRKAWNEDVQRLHSRLAAEIPEMSRPDSLKIYRIYRDTRFSKDKTPYKTYFSATFMPYPSLTHASAGYYLQMGVGHDYTESGFYGGIWLPESKILSKLRHAIVDNIEEFEGIIRSPRLVEVAGEGWMAETLKTGPAGWPKDHPQKELLRLKEYGKFSPQGKSFFLRKDWVERGADIMLRFKPMVDFLNYSIFEE